MTVGISRNGSDASESLDAVKVNSREDLGNCGCSTLRGVVCDGDDDVIEEVLVEEAQPGAVLRKEGVSSKARIRLGKDCRGRGNDSLRRAADPGDARGDLFWRCSGVDAGRGSELQI